MRYYDIIDYNKHLKDKKAVKAISDLNRLPFQNLSTGMRKRKIAE